MKKVRWGVLSTAKIGQEKVIPAMQAAQFCDVQAIASRSLPRAQQVAAALGIARAYGSPVGEIRRLGHTLTWPDQAPA